MLESWRAEMPLSYKISILMPCLQALGSIVGTIAVPAIPALGRLSVGSSSCACPMVRRPRSQSSRPRLPWAPVSMFTVTHKRVASGPVQPSPLCSLLWAVPRWTEAAPMLFGLRLHPGGQIALVLCSLCETWDFCALLNTRLGKRTIDRVSFALTASP